jgi:hypothetical protein
VLFVFTNVDGADRSSWGGLISGAKSVADALNCESAPLGVLTTPRASVAVPFCLCRFRSHSQISGARPVCSPAWGLGRGASMRWAATERFRPRPISLLRAIFNPVNTRRQKEQRTSRPLFESPSQNTQLWFGTHLGVQEAAGRRSVCENTTAIGAKQKGDNKGGWATLVCSKRRTTLSCSSGHILNIAERERAPFKNSRLD